MSNGYWKSGGCSSGGCVFRAHGEVGVHTNGGCRCVSTHMTPDEVALVRGWIRGAVAALADAREEGRRDERAELIPRAKSAQAEAAAIGVSIANDCMVRLLKERGESFARCGNKERADECGCMARAVEDGVHLVVLELDARRNDLERMADRLVEGAHVGATGDDDGAY